MFLLCYRLFLPKFSKISSFSIPFLLTFLLKRDMLVITIHYVYAQ